MAVAVVVCDGIQAEIQVMCVVGRRGNRCVVVDAVNRCVVVDAVDKCVVGGRGEATCSSDEERRMQQWQVRTILRCNRAHNYSGEKQRVCRKKLKD
jgi:hypothetical protein